MNAQKIFSLVLLFSIAVVSASVIHAFTHSNRGYWNLCHIPLLPVTGEVDPNDFGSSLDHKTEFAEPGYN
jgi:hypothetical protein